MKQRRVAKGKWSVSHRVFALACFLSLVFGARLEAESVVVTTVYSPNLGSNGRIEGSLQQLRGEPITLNSGVLITEDLLLPGSPSVQTNGTVNWQGVQEGTGVVTPSGYSVRLNGGVTLRYVQTRTDPIVIPAVPLPANASGTRSVSINQAGENPGDWGTLRNLTINAQGANLVVPPGAYQDFSANGGTLVFGVAGASQPAVYSFNQLTLNGAAKISLAGPTIIHLRNSWNIGSVVGDPANPSWLEIQIAQGGITLNSGAAVYGSILAPKGHVIVNGQTTLVGRVRGERFTLNSGGVVRWANTLPNEEGRRPIAEGQSVTVEEDVPQSVRLTGTNPEGGALTFTLLSSPQHGTLTGTGVSGEFLYTPEADYHGPDHFTFKASNGVGDSEAATVSIRVTPINDIPEAQSARYSTEEDLPLEIVLLGIDRDGDGLTFTPSQPIHGTLTPLNRAGRYLYTPKVNFHGEEVFSFTVSDGVANSVSATVHILVTPVNDPPTVEVSAKERLVAPELMAVKATVWDDGNGSGSGVSLVWSKVSGPGEVTFSNLNEAETTASYNKAGLYRLRATVNDGEFEASADLFITVEMPNLAPVVHTGERLRVPYTSAPLSIHGSVTDDGKPEGSALTHLWEKVSGPGEVLFSNAENLATTAKFSLPGEYILKLRASDSALSSEATVAIHLLEPNKAPKVTVEPVAEMEFGQEATLIGKVSDDGLPEGGGLQTRWTKLSGPGEVRFADEFSAEGLANFSEPGVYTLRLAASDSELSAHADVQVILKAIANRPPVVHAGEDQAISLATILLHGSASDDGRPEPYAGLELTWTKVEGPGTVTFDNPNRSDATATFSEPGVYRLRLTATDGELDAYDEVKIEAARGNQPPNVRAGPDQGVDMALETTLTGGVTDDGLPLGGALSTQWKKISGPGEAVLADSSKLSTHVSVSVEGEYTFELSATDSVLTGRDTVTLRFGDLNEAPVVDAGADQEVNYGLTRSPNLLVNPSGELPLVGTEIPGWTKVLGTTWTRVNGGAGGRPVASHGTHFFSAGTTAEAELAQTVDVSAFAAIIDTGSQIFQFRADLRSKAETKLDHHWITLEFLGGNQSILAQRTFDLSEVATDWTIFADAQLAPAQTRYVRVRLVSESSFSDGVNDAWYDNLALHAVTVGAGTLVGSASDDGKPDGSQLSTEWTQVAGPAQSLVITPHDLTTQVFALVPGEYEFELSASDGRAVSRDRTHLSVVTTPGNHPPSVLAGDDLILPSPSAVADLSGIVSDDQTPLEGMRVSWSKVQGSGEVTFGSSTSLQTTAQFSAAGTYVLRLSASDGEFVAFDELIVTVDCPEDPIPMDFAFVIDVSGSMEGQRIADARKAAVTLAERLDSLFDQACVIPFQSTAHVAAPLTNNIERVAVVIESLRTTGGTAIEAGIQVSTQELLENGRGSQAIPVMILLSDGESNLNAAVQQANAAKAAGIRIISVGLGTTAGHQLLQAIASTPGDYYFVPDSTNLSALYAGLAQSFCRYSEQHIEVHAGSDLPGLHADDAARLHGRVDFTRVPSDYETAIRWVKVSGPGEVTFADVNSPVTTATFSEPGYYSLALYGSASGSGLSLTEHDIISVRVGLPCFVSPKGIVGWWDLDGDREDSVKRAIAEGRTSFEPGIVGLAAVFNGVDDYIKVPGSLAPDVNSGAGFTAEFWVKTADGSSSQGLLGWGNDNLDGLRVSYTSSQLLIELRNSGGSTRSLSTGRPSNGVWNHIAVTYRYSDGRAELYLNGVSKSAATSAGYRPRLLQDLYIGATASGGRTSGAIDEVTIFDRALEPEEIFEIYDAKSSGKCPIDPNSAPLIDAGKDRIVPAVSGRLSLEGKVSDDGLPVGSTLCVRWSKLSGPGDVTFTAFDSAETEAAFTMPGLYVLKLEGSDGLALSEDTIEVRVAQPSAVASPAGTIAWWPLNGSSEEVVSGLHSPLVGGEFHDGLVGRSLRFNGVDHFVATPFHPGIDVSNASGFTVEFWFNIPAGTNNSLFAWGDGNLNGVALYLSSTTLYVDMRNAAGGGRSLSSPRPLNNQWHHVAFTYRKADGRAEVYLNGALASSTTSSGYLPAPLRNLYFGKIPGRSFGLGSMDEVALYNRSLEAEEIFAIYEAGGVGRAPWSSNQAPVVNAGEDQSVSTVSETILLQGKVVDDELPEGAVVKSRWSRVSGPGEVAITNPEEPSTEVTVSAPGLHLFKLVADDGSLQSEDLVEVRVGLDCTPDLPPGLVAWWRFNGSTEDSLTGLLSPAVGGGFTDGFVGQAIRFDGVDDFVLTRERPEIDVTSGEGFTMEFWADAPAGVGSSLVAWGNGVQNGASLYLTSTTLYVDMVSVTGSSRSISTSRPASGQWNHYAFTYRYSDGRAELYVNGVLRSASSSSGYRPRLLEDLYFGRVPGRSFGAASLDEFGLFNRPLSAPEILSIYQAGHCGKAPVVVNRAPVVNAGADRSVMLGSASGLHGIVSDDGPEANLAILWDQFDGPAVALISNAEIANPAVEFLAPGVYRFRLRASDGEFSAADEVTITVTDSLRNGAPSVDVGPDLSVVFGQVAHLKASITDDGMPTGTLTSLWSKVSGPGVVQFSAAQQASTQASFSVEGTYVIQNRAWDGALEGIDRLTVTVSKPVNQAPVVNLGPDREIAYGEALVLHFEIDDDELPSDSLVVRRAQTAGPVGFQLEDLPDDSVRLNFPKVGTYGLRYEVSDGELTTRANLTINVTQSGLASPVVQIASPLNGGEAVVGGAVNLEATASSENGSIERVDFYVGGNLLGSVYAPPYRFQWNPSSPVGTVSLHAIAYDQVGAQGKSPDVEITKVPLRPRVSLTYPGAYHAFATSATVKLQATASAGGQGAAIAKVEFLVDGAMVGSDVSAPYSVDWVTPAQVGEITLQARATDIAGQVSTTAPIVVRIAGDPSAPLTALLDPDLDGQTIIEPTSIPGLVDGPTLASWSVEYRRQGSACAEWVVLQAGDEPVSEGGELAIFDPSLHLNGLYEVRLTARNAFGSAVIDSRKLAVEGGMKAGHYTLSFSDLNVPLGGLPLSITRTYDSRDRCPGDFGHGWGLDVDSIRLDKSDAIGAKWSIEGGGGNLSDPPVYQLADRGPHLLSIRMPDGETLRFSPKVVLAGGVSTLEDGDGDAIAQAWMPFAYTQSLAVIYRPRGGTMGATLSPRGYRARNPWTGASQVISGTARFYVSAPLLGDISLATHENSAQDAPVLQDATGWELVLRDGRTYLFDEEGRLESMSDGDGNSLTLTRDGAKRIQRVTHSSGKQILFNRNSQGFITEVIDPAGNRCRYQYNVEGDLVAFYDRVASASASNAPTQQYAYSPGTHYLRHVSDAYGAAVIRNDYDANGRLCRTLDASGKETVYTHSVSGRTTTIRDRAGHITTHRYDPFGNVTETVLPDGTRVQNEYLRWADGRPSDLKTKASITGLFGNPDGTASIQTRTTTYTYADPNAPAALDGLVRKIIDPEGQSTTLTYDARGNLLTLRDPLGQVTTYTYHPESNRLATELDAMGNSSSYQYDGRGRLTHHTRKGTVRGTVQDVVTEYRYNTEGLLVEVLDPAGNATQYEYDESGNRLRETSFVTVRGTISPAVTECEYDANGNILRMWDAENQGATPTVESVYNANGKPVVVYDALRRGTHLTYNAQGEIESRIYPDGTEEKMEYDAEGRLESHRDKRGNVTRFVYDSRGRIIETLFADAGGEASISLSRASYDASGRVLTATDANQNATLRIYDKVGRQIGNVDPLGHESEYRYDAAGRCVSFIDSLGRETSYTYDPLSRLTQIRFADATTLSYSYDARGYRTGETDQNGLTKGFQYDELGRLLNVIDASGKSTGYTYDEAGNQTSQVDANLNATQYYYDRLGRRIERRLPMGQSETYEYDAVGNLVQRKDFNGTITTYSYDSLNRLLLRDSNHERAAASRVSFSYTPSQRASMTDASGQTRYYYDTRDRLTRKETPQGVLNYQYDNVGNLTQIKTDTPNGVEKYYSYDALNRLSSVEDTNLGVTQYAYDPVGNLEKFTTANGVTHRYVYNGVNLLSQLTVQTATFHGGSQPLAGYHYTRGASGHKLSVVEEFPGLGGTVSTRSAVYTYDSLQRLTKETVTSNGGQSGVINYNYDAVGNRLSRTSSIAKLANQQFSYDANDRSIGETYDANGNTKGGVIHLDASGAEAAGRSVSDSFDSENRLIVRSSPALVEVTYDGDGNKVKERFNGQEFQYLVDGLNPTGHAQVIEEQLNGTLIRLYCYGHDLLAQDERKAGGDWFATFYGYDGHGSVRLLTNPEGAVTDTYIYDAYGTLLESQGTTFNRYRYSGERFEETLGLYNLRARYLNASNGRFWSMDGYEGSNEDPQSLHKYQYCHGDPVNGWDPTGHTRLTEITAATGIRVSLTFRLAMPSAYRAMSVVGEMLAGQSLTGGYVALSTGAAIKAGQKVNIPASQRLAEEILEELWDSVARSRGKAAAKTTGQLALPAPSVIPNAGGVIRSFTQQTDQTYYRVFTQGQTGSFLTAVRPGSSAFGQEALALPPQNTAAFIQEVLVPAGTRLQRSRALAVPEFGRFRGGAEQFQLLDRIPNQNFGPGVPLP